MSDNGKILFELIADFSVKTVLGWVACTYKNSALGPKVAAGDAFVSIILPFAQEQFNIYARNIYDRSDEYINEHFDKMLSVVLTGTYAPIDILNMIVMLSLYLLTTLDISSVINDDYVASMRAVEAHLRALVHRKRDLADTLRGHSSVTSPPSLTGDVYSFAYDRHVQSENGPVRLSTL